MKNIIKKILKESHNDDLNNYMFFSNLKQMRKQIDTILEMDIYAVDQVLSDGHSWAVDHIATSKDDLEEVHNFLNNYK
jgi:hypothetical protein